MSIWVTRRQIEIRAEEEGPHHRREIGSHQAVPALLQPGADLGTFLRIIDLTQDDPMVLPAPEPLDGIRDLFRLRCTNRETAKERHRRLRGRLLAHKDDRITGSAVNASLGGREPSNQTRFQAHRVNRIGELYLSIR
jgi:hypothetical protein